MVFADDQSDAVFEYVARSDAGMFLTDEHRASRDENPRVRRRLRFRGVGRLLLIGLRRARLIWSGWALTTALRIHAHCEYRKERNHDTRKEHEACNKYLRGLGALRGLVFHCANPLQFG